MNKVVNSLVLFAFVAIIITVATNVLINENSTSTHGCSLNATGGLSENCTLSNDEYTALHNNSEQIGKMFGFLQILLWPLAFAVLITVLWLLAKIASNKH